MNKDLKEVIILHIFANLKEFNLNNAVIEKFRYYIYDPEGAYLIGGKEVSEFINNAIKLILH